MKELLRIIYFYFYKEDLEPQQPSPVSIIIKTSSEKLYYFFLSFYGIDPTPNDEQPDEYSCVYSLTTILNKFIGFKVLTYTPNLVEELLKDSRFKRTYEFTKGAIVISETNTGNGRIVGHCGVIGEKGKILSNSSETGLWVDKYDHAMWIERYSRVGQLSLFIFELV